MYVFWTRRESKRVKTSKDHPDRCEILIRAERRKPPPAQKYKNLTRVHEPKAKMKKECGTKTLTLKSAQPLALPTQLRRIVLVQAGGLGRNEVERLRPSPGGAWPPSRRRAVVAATPCYSSLQPLFKGGRFEISGAT